MKRADLKTHNKNNRTRRSAMKVLLLDTMFQRYGSDRHPKIESYETLKERGDLIDLRHIPNDAVMIYISHEWRGTDHPDPGGAQMYHLLLLLERLQRGDVERTDMDAFHSLLYGHNQTTTSNEWIQMLDSQNTYIFYDGLCVRGVRARSVRISIISLLMFQLYPQITEIILVLLTHNCKKITSKINARMHTRLQRILDSRFALEHRYRKRNERKRFE